MIYLKNILNTIKKNLEFIQIAKKKDFEFFSDNQNLGFAFYLILILLPSK